MLRRYHLFIQMFMKDELEILLDKKRDKELREVAKVIKRCIIGYLARKRFLEKRAAIMLIQKVYKVCKGRVLPARRTREHCVCS